MKHKQQPSDEEIQSYMNFDRLLDNRKTALDSMRINTILKWSVPALTITAALLVWFYFPMNEDSAAGNGTNMPQEKLTETAIDTTLAAPVDGTTNHETIPEEKSIGETRTKDSQRAQRPAIVPLNPEVKQTETPATEYVQAEPVTGYPDLYDYFNSNLVYPNEALKDSIQGVQTVSFIINTQGKPEQIDFLKSLGEPFEKEARRLIENMPAWKPAIMNGKPVASKISLPLTFQIQKLKHN